MAKKKKCEEQLPATYPVDEAQAAWNLVRVDREKLLRASDERAMRYFKAGQPFPEVEIAYAEALRNITTQTDPENIQWPEEPKLPEGL